MSFRAALLSGDRAGRLGGDGARGARERRRVVLQADGGGGGDVAGSLGAQRVAHAALLPLAAAPVRGGRSSCGADDRRHHAE